MPSLNRIGNYIDKQGVCTYYMFMLNQRQKIDIAWAAGLFEGEGNIYRKDKKRGRGSGSAFTMSLKMKDADVIKRFHRIVKCGTVKQRTQKQPYCEMWEWVLSRTNEILDLCQVLLPFMGKRRTKQIKKATKGKIYLKPRKKLKVAPLSCKYMKRGEVSNRGAHYHIRKGEKPCLVCAYNQRLYYRKWREAFFNANR